MEIRENEYEKIAHVLPKPRGNVAVSLILFLNALLYAIENGCKWRKLPEKYGKWNTIYKRANRWAKNGTLALVFTELQKQEIIKIKIERIVHPDAHGAEKKRKTIDLLRNQFESSKLQIPAMRLNLKPKRFLLPR